LRAGHGADQARAAGVRRVFREGLAQHSLLVAYALQLEAQVGDEEPGQSEAC
jgi:hypothetical protein